MVCLQFSIALCALALSYAPDFGPPTLYAAGSGPMAKGDFNGDGIVDLVVSENNSLLVLLGKGDGTFQPAIASPARQSVYADILVADFNGDGRLDVAGVQTDYFVIQYGNGDGTFNPPTWIAAAGYRAATGDVNGDGLVDLVVVYAEWWPDDSGWSASGGLAVYLNRGDGTFDMISNAYTGNHDVCSMELVDYDRDGDLDLVICDYKWGLLLYEGNGAGAFNGASDFNGLGQVEYEPTGAVVGDLNNDGALDVVIGPGYYGKVQPVIGHGNGSFSIGPGYPAGGHVTPAGGDFNRDGKLDVICSDNVRPGVVAVVLGDGAGGFGPPQESMVDSAPYVRKLVVADFNGDGYPDVAAAIGSNVCVVLNDGRWNSAPPPMPQMNIGDVSVVEGNSGSRSALFTVSLSAASSAQVTVNYSTASGSAAEGSDYRATSGTLVFAPGETTKTISVEVFGDRTYEDDESFYVNLTNATGAIIVDGQGKGVIINDDPLATIDSVTLPEGKKGQTTRFRFTVSLTAPSDQTIRVTCKTANGTAKTTDNDYVAKNGTLVFAPGETKKTFDVDVIGDNKREPNEYFYVEISGPNVPPSGLYGYGNIMNDDR